MRMLPMGKKLTIAIDIDGTVADSSGIDFDQAEIKPEVLLVAKPIQGAVEAVKKLFEEGHKIVFYTARSMSSKQITERWLNKHGFPFHHVECEKLVAHVYIDDRAIVGDDWEKVLENLQRTDLPGAIACKDGRV